MTRRLALSILLLASIPPLFAEDAKQEEIARVVAMQATMKQARDALDKKDPAKAVTLLEEGILLSDGQVPYLDLLRDAYRARVRELQLANGDAKTIQHIERQLKTLEFSVGEEKPAKAAETVKPADTSKQAEPEKKAAESAKPTEPEKKPAEPAKPAEPEKKPAEEKKPARAEAPKVDIAKLRSDARRLFAERKYQEAADALRKLETMGEVLAEDEQQCQAYCRLVAVAAKLKEKTLPADAKAEVASAMAAGGKSVKAFGDSLLKEIDVATADTDSFVTAQTEAGGSFTIGRSMPRLKSAEVLKYAEQQRLLAQERWTGARGAAWKTPCPIFLYETAAAYSAATGKQGNGHSTLKFDGDRVTTRRIDLHLENPNAFDAQLPREIHYQVITELFADEPLPAWAEFGMTAQAEPQGFRGRNRRMAGKLVEERKAMPLDKLLELKTAPGEGKLTAYYVQGVTLVDFLVRLKGPRTLVVFLQESPRRGVERTLTRHFGFKDLADLEKQWKADLMKAD